ncbi:ABC transporter permease [Propioniciclava coleopterorum]|uniref:ABC transporter permease n=1 Tax=Propioniciclava coleopterorum TaxID=2714937 RepID=A0A6G7Y669_9ACTN|nr:ABC transporter permease [Propioniciclava coleopterorum]QIK72305.1 ABC transporter permease [Propioniciclava coleopterorum]
MSRPPRHVARASPTRGAALAHAARELRQHPARYAAMLLAVVVSVTFLAASQVVLATESHALAARSVLYASRADVIVDTYVWNWGGAVAQRDGALSVAETALKADPAVVVVEPFSQVRGELVNGERVAGVMLTSALSSPALRWAEPVEGRLPDGPGETLLAQETAAQLGLRVGDPVQLNIVGAAPLTVVGLTRERGYGTPPAYVPASTIAEAGKALPPADPRVIINPRDAAEKTPGSSGGTVGVRLLVRTADPSQAPAVAADVADALYAAGHLRVVAEAKLASTVRAQAAEAEGRSESATPLLVTAAAGVALLVGALIIGNTLTILLTQRRRSIGLLRAVGATRRQVLERVLAEAVLLGAVGSLVAVPLAVAAAAVIAGWATHSLDFGLVVPWGAVAGAVGLGFLITVVAAVGPVLRVTRVSPLEALQPAVPVSRAAAHARRRALACALVGALGPGR